MENIKTVRPSKRATFFHKSDRMVAVELNNGAIEIYKIDPADKIEMFQGYIQDLNISGILRMRATQALYSGGAESFGPLQLTFAEAA